MARSAWRALLEQLAHRGGNVREAGAFLLAAADDEHVEDVVYFDDLDAESLVGSIALSGEAYSKLWQYCRRTNQRVVADVHTHPSRIVALSAIDRANPLVAMPGHIAIIVPYYASRRVRRRDIGIHHYVGAQGWRSFFGWAAHRRLRLTR